MEDFKPSPYQQAIYDFIQKGEGSAIVEAVAGSGKTTTIVKALDLIPKNHKKNTVFLAFNRSIKLELDERVPEGVQVLTLNSLGHRAWMKFAGRRVFLNANKTRNILLEHPEFDNYDEWTVKKLWSPVRKMVSIAKSAGLVPKDVGGASGLVPDTHETWYKLLNHFDIQMPITVTKGGMQVDPEPVAIEMARKALRISLNDWNQIDFDDQLYMTVVYGAPVNQYKWVFVDEAQDVSDIQRALLSMAKAKEGRLVAVGDPRQAIYGFRGADSQSLENIAKTFNTQRLPLSISYRCPQNVVKEAQKYVGHIQAHEDAIEGEVQDLGGYKPNMFDAGDMVLCRCNAPIIKLAYKLIGARKPAKVMGRDIGKGLTSLIKKLKPNGISGLREKLAAWRAKETEKALKLDPEADLSNIEDKYEVIMVFIEESGADTVPNLTTAIENLFSDGAKNAVILSSIHRAKGLEADRVFILDPHLMPHKAAKKPWQIQQEINLQYVAVTRSKKGLYYITTPEKNEK